MNGQTPAGWFTDPQDDTQFRYWDGAQWTEHRAPRTAQAPPAAQGAVAGQTPTAQTAQTPAAPSAYQAGPTVPVAAAVTKQRSWFLRHKVLTGLLAVGAVVVAIVASSQGNGTSTPSATDGGGHQSHATPGTATPGKSSPSAPSASASATPTVSYTTAQEQAIGSAHDYLDTSHFSQVGLIGQLSSKYGDGFDRKDAAFAVNHLDVDWNAQAVGAAKDYLNTSHFSKVGLTGQLSAKAGDQFTRAQAEYAVNNIDVDWNAQAVGAAKDYLATSHFSRDGLIGQLSSQYGDQFTRAQAIYAVNHVGL